MEIVLKKLMEMDVGNIIAMIFIAFILWKLISKAFDKIEKRFENIDKRFENIDKRFENIDKRFDELRSEIKTLDDKINSLDKRVVSIETILKMKEWSFHSENYTHKIEEK